MSFLDVLLTEYPDAAEQILHSWYGPERLQHDFIFKDLAVEIKSISSIDKRSVKISSLHQLETNLSELYLYVATVLEAPDEPVTLRCERSAPCSAWTTFGRWSKRGMTG